MKYSILAPAKINLFLDVTKKRPDGYHEITSVMQAVSLFDEIVINVTEGDKTEIFLNGSEPSLKWDETNLVYKACKLFIEEAKIEGYRFDIYVEKKIPACAGMAGGSTDAASTLLRLNMIFGDFFGLEKLCELGARLGADVPFCIRGGTCLCEGVGEKITPLESLFGAHIVCAIGSSSVSTPVAFSLLDEKFGTNPGKSASIEAFLANVKKRDLKAIGASLFNKFESVIASENPEIQKIKCILLKNGALGALMSGSGPSVFGIFDNETDQKNAFFALQKEKIKAFLCNSL